MHFYSVSTATLRKTDGLDTSIKSFVLFFSPPFFAGG